MAGKGQGTGRVITEKGYVRLKRRGPYRDWYEHRKVMYEACLVFCYYPINGDLPSVGTPPKPVTVEHLNHNRQHNCLCNLLMLDKRIHDALSLTHAANVRKVQDSVYVGGASGWISDPDAPDWVNEA